MASATVVAYARLWLADEFPYISEAAANVVPEADLRLIVGKHYPGGWDAFAAKHGTEVA